jgi:hypothetical protein
MMLEMTRVCVDPRGRVIVAGESVVGAQISRASMTRDLVYYGDRNTLMASLIVNNMDLFDPRHGAELSVSDGNCQIKCGQRTFQVPVLPEAEATALLLSAHYVKNTHTRRPHALLRDSLGNYYYVDRGRAQGEEKSFRLFVGPKGAMVLQKMINAVSDSAGEIFTTKAGDLRLLIDREKQSEWVKGEKKTTLRLVPIEENYPVIYNELGVYAGERFGNPCDDL